jgi:hypothetical protein
MEKLISISAVLAVFVVTAGRLPQTLKVMRVAQLQLIKESQASNWGSSFKVKRKGSKLLLIL